MIKISIPASSEKAYTGSPGDNLTEARDLEKSKILLTKKNKTFSICVYDFDFVPVKQPKFCRRKC